MKIALFTSAHWNSPELIGRLRGIAEILGWTILPGLVEDSIQLSIVDQADLVVFLKDFPHRWEDFRKILEKAHLAGKPIALDLHEFSLKLPVAHTYRRDQHKKNTLYALFQSILEADALLASTADTAEFLTAINSNTYVIPDGFNERLWPAFQTRQLQDDHDQRLTIGYTGYDINTGDFSPVTPVLKRLLEYYSSGLQVLIIGSRPPQELLDQEGVVWVPVDKLDYPKYAQAVQAHPIDIGITPLALHSDNKFISPTNFFEYTAIGAVGVYTRFGAYEQVVEHQATGFLASSSEEWHHYLVQLIESPSLRFQMAQNARKVVEEKWLLGLQSSHWEQALNTILSKGVVPVDPARQLLWDLTQEVKTWDQDLDWELEYERQQSSKLIQERNHALRERDEGREMIIQLNDDLENIYRSREYLQGSRIVRIMDAVAARGTWGEKMLSLGERTAQKIYQVIAKPAPRELSQGISPHQIAPAFSYDVFVFPMVGMENRLHRAHHFAREFAREGHRVFYVDSQFYPHTRMVITPIDERIYEIRLPASPEQTSSRAVEFDQKALVMDAVNHLCEVFSIQDAVLFVDWLYWAPVVADLRHQFNWKVIWDVLDSNLENNVDSLVERLTQVSDLVIYSSEFVSDHQKRKQPNWMLIRNGAEFEPFADRTHYVPQDLVHLQGPVIGYHGPLSKAFDLSLVTELARKNPEWQFVLLGAGSSEAFAQLQGASNIHIFGQKPDRELPAYLQAFDLCIIPLQEAPGTNTAAPLLLFDYLSAGKPVVASRLVALEGYSDYVSFAQGVEAWEEQIRIALANPGPEVIQKRVVFARQNSWMVRLQELSQQIFQVYPKVSIVILTYNNLAYNQYCLESIYSHTQYPNFEVIVVDNASTDGTPDFLRAFAENRSNLSLQLNVENKGFAGGNNQGARLASGEYIVFLNNDTVVTPGWLSRLIAHLKDPGVGMVGPVSNSSGNESCIPVDYSYLDGMIPFAREYTKKHAGRAFQIPMLAFMCVAMRRSVFDEVGYLDERFGVGMFEDDDYAYRLKLKGYKILCAEDVFIHHWGSASFSKLQEERYKKLFEENKHKFEEKWGKKWKPHQFRQSRD